MAAASSTAGTYRPFPSCYHCNEALIKDIISCNNCQSAFYCSEAHGQADWEVHKGFCKKQPHDFSKITDFWVSKIKRPPAHSQPKKCAMCATALSSDTASSSLTLQGHNRTYHVIKYNEQTKALESVTERTIDAISSMFVADVTKRLAKLHPDQILFVTNSIGPGALNYDGLFIYRFVPEAQVVAAFPSTAATASTTPNYSIVGKPKNM